MRIIGIDPGYAITGYGIIDYTGGKFAVVDYGLIKTEAKTPFPQRLNTLHAAVRSLCERYTPAVMCVEELFFSRNTTTAIGTAQARGVIVLAGAQLDKAVYEYTPMQVKLAVTGYGKADKAQVQEMVKVLLKLQRIPKPDDVADALAIAICHAHSGNRQEALAVSGYQ